LASRLFHQESLISFLPRKVMNWKRWAAACYRGPRILGGV
jgi:hypothetical protein